jgi:pimeloyl-ACP methyl ester carboxylesterase
MVRVGEIEVGRERIALWDTEKSENVLLLLHGNSVSKEAFAPQVHAFGQKFRLIALDLPGHGTSDDARDGKTYCLGGYASVVAAVLEQLGVKRYVVLGHSLGGHIALELAAMRVPPAGLVLTGVPPFRRSASGLAEAFGPDPRSALGLKGSLLADEVHQFATGVLDAAGDTNFWRERIARTDPAARERLGATLLQSRDQRQLAEEYRGPTLVVNGAEDTFINPDYVAQVRYQDLWGGTVHRITDQGHAPHLNAPGEFNAILEAFLEGVWSAPGRHQAEVE